MILNIELKRIFVESITALLTDFSKIARLTIILEMREFNYASLI